MKSRHFSSIFVRIFVFTLGLIVMLPALNTLYTHCSYRYLENRTVGVIDHTCSGRDFGGRPLIQDVDLSGSVHEFKSRAKTHLFQTPQKGEKIKVLIHKSDPQKAIVDNLFYYVLLPLIFLACGCYCCLIALLNKKDISAEMNKVAAALNILNLNDYPQSLAHQILLSRETSIFSHHDNLNSQTKLNNTIYQ